MLVSTIPTGPPERTRCSNNVRQIVIAILNYESSYGQFPPAYTVDKDGNRLHSWRTLILPFLEEGNRYDAIDFSKPWNHPDNKSLSEPIPTVYRCPGDSRQSSRDGTTVYIGIIGEETIWQNNGNATLLSDCTDDPSNTFLVIESKANRIHWMSPNDLQYSKMLSNRNLLTSEHAKGTNVGFADGSVRFVLETMKDEHLKAALTIAGGELVEID